MDDIVNKQHYMSEEDKYAYTVLGQYRLYEQQTEDGLYGMAYSLKKIRDEKLYRSYGYNSFDAFCKVESVLKRSQIYNYIAIIEKLPKKFVQSTGQIGTEKLCLLTRLDEEQRSEITETVNLENTTVKELREQINRLTGEKLQLKTRMEEQEELIDSLRDEISNGTDVTETDEYKDLQGEMRYYQMMCRKHEVEIVEKAQELAQLEAQIRELESRPIEVQASAAIPVEETEEYKRVAELSARRRAELLRVCDERNAARAEVEELKKQMTDPDKGMKRYVIRMTERQLNGFCKAVRDNCPEYSPILRDAEVIE